jgi:phosphoserine phosphatase
MRFPWKLVTTDIDGTLTVVHGWGVIAAAVGRSKDYEEVNRRFRGGGVSEEDHLRDLLELAVGAPWSTVRGALEATPRVHRIREAVGELQRLGARVALLTHNPGYVCQWYQEAFGFDAYDGTPGAPVLDGHIGPLGEIRADKRVGMQNLLRRFSVDPMEAVHVGDALPDALVFPHVGGGVALNSRSVVVEGAADLSLRTDDLTVLVRRLQTLVPRRPVNGD